MQLNITIHVSQESELDSFSNALLNMPNIRIRTIEKRKGIAFFEEYQFFLSLIGSTAIIGLTQVIIQLIKSTKKSIKINNIEINGSFSENQVVEIIKSIYKFQSKNYAVNNDLSEKPIHEEIVSLISNNKIDEVFSLLHELPLDQEIKKEVILLNSAWECNRLNYLKGLETHERVQVEWNRIKEALISLLSRISIE